ncbi:MAG: sigma-70 family RNA polymerase sigma factor [Actinomycetaceae bacterium]|nr:sigma-70 family RNA polymerase sigma factor [Actinomycetaceae bacterium]
MDVNLTRLSDAALVSLVSDGEYSAFTELVTRHGGAMKRYAKYFTSSDADADEAVQEALITAWQSVDDLNNPKALRSWLMKITARKSLDLVRSRKAHSPIEDVDVATRRPGPQARADMVETVQQLKETVNRLPQNQREVWVLREIGAHTYQEIAEILQVSTASVRGRLERARVTIAKELEGWR